LRRVLTIAIVILLTRSTSAQKADVRIRPLLTKHVEAMDEFARWCGRNGLFREKNRVLVAIIAFDFDHQYARHESGWRRLGKKKWERVKGFRRPIKTNKDMAPGWKARANESANRYVTDVAPKLAALKPSLTKAELRRLHSTMLGVAPRHDGLRVLLGERKVGRRWLLKESLPTKGRRKQLAQNGKLLLEGAGDPAETGYTEAERKVGMEWKSSSILHEVRVVGTVPKKDVQDACRLARATLVFARMAMHSPVKPFQGFTIYVLNSREEARRFLHFFPGVSDANRKAAEGLSSCWLGDSSNVVIWTESKERRREWIARQTVAMLLQNGWNIRTQQASLFEGLGIYLSHKMCGFRTTWYVRPSRYGRTGRDKDETQTLRKTKDWLRLARRRVGSTPPTYRRLFSLDLTQMVTDDLLDSFVFAAYLMEAARDEREAYLTKIGQGQNFEHAVMDVWGMDVPALETRVFRWLKETKSR
jgi:hypothetical protein